MFYLRTVYLENYAIWFNSYADYSSSGSLILMLKGITDNTRNMRNLTNF